MNSWEEELCDLDLLDEVIARNSFEDFVRYMMPQLEFSAFHCAYYRTLDAFARGKVKRLIVSVPPQHGKSLAASQLLPAMMLGQRPDMKIAIASYNATLASRFNKRTQRTLSEESYLTLFPGTRIKSSVDRSLKSRRGEESTTQTSTEFDIIGHDGGLISVGREGALTGNTVDAFILDDLYKDAMEANSPVVRQNCWEWYTDVVRTRMHNLSAELIVFTRWHEEDLIGLIGEREQVVPLTQWEQLDNLPPEVWLHLNFEAIKDSEPTEIDPRSRGEALWPERHSIRTLLAKQNLDRIRFECMYQGHPTSKEGLLYGENIATYAALPAADQIVGYDNYTDTADGGDDYLCSVSYVRTREGICCVTDLVFSREAMEQTEPAVANMLLRSGTRRAQIESNNGGRGFARAVQRMTPGVKIEWFHQSNNKEARILSNAATVLQTIIMPEDWKIRWPEFYTNVTTYRRQYRANRWHDAADVLTGIVERGAERRGKIITFR